MNVVWVTSHQPSLGEGGAAAHEFELLRAVSRHHQIHVIGAPVPDQDRISNLDSIGVTSESVEWTPEDPPASRLEAYRQRFVRGLGTTLWGDRNRIEALRRAVIARQNDHPVDLVHLVQGDVAPLAISCRVPTVLLLFDVFSRQIQGELGRASRLRDRVHWAFELRKARRWERRWYSRVGAIASVSATDAETLSAIVSRSVDVIPNPIASSFYETPAALRSDSVVTYIGTLDHRPNMDGVRWLREEIWPIVTARRPDVELRIVGWNPLASVREDARRLGADLYANVEDVRAFYWETAVAIAPVRLGSGLRNKVIHAMACRAPVVATDMAIEGLDIVSGRHALIAQSPASFAGSIVRTLDDRAAAQRRADAAWDFVQRFRPEVVGEKLDNWWAEARARSRS